MPLIEEIWAYVVTESPGEEGIPAVSGTGGMVIPLVGADGERMQSYRPHAVSIAADMGKQVKLVRFSNMEVIAVFDPP